MVLKMSVKSIVKGAGKKVGKAFKEVFPDSSSPNMKGPFQRLSGKALQDPPSLYQSVVPYHLANKYSIPLAAGGMAVTGGIATFKGHNQAKLGTVEAGSGLSGMTSGTIANASANVITPGLKKLNDAGSPKARQISASIRDNMQHNINTSGAEGDIVFALHNMR